MPGQLNDDHLIKVDSIASCSPLNPSNVNGFHAVSDMNFTLQTVSSPRNSLDGAASAVCNGSESENNNSNHLTSWPSSSSSASTLASTSPATSVATCKIPSTTKTTSLQATSSSSTLLTIETFNHSTSVININRSELPLTQLNVSEPCYNRHQHHHHQVFRFASNTATHCLQDIGPRFLNISKSYNVELENHQSSSSPLQSLPVHSCPFRLSDSSLNSSMPIATLPKHDLNNRNTRNNSNHNGNNNNNNSLYYANTINSINISNSSLNGAQHATNTDSSVNTCQQSKSSKTRRRVATIAQRRAANIRERRRMFHLNSAFDKLRKKVPTFAYEKRLSRIETLRLAVMYISFMTEVLRNRTVL